MFETIKTKTNFSKEEIKEMIDKYADKHYVNIEVRSNGCLSIWIGGERESYKGANNEN